MGLRGSPRDALTCWCPRAIINTLGAFAGIRNRRPLQADEFQKSWLPLHWNPWPGSTAPRLTSGWSQPHLDPTGRAAVVRRQLRGLLGWSHLSIALSICALLSPIHKDSLSGGVVPVKDPCLIHSSPTEMSLIHFPSSLSPSPCPMSVKNFIFQSFLSSHSTEAFHMEANTTVNGNEWNAY